jgi:hypothetical protein
MVLTLLGQPQGNVLAHAQLSEVAGWFAGGRLKGELRGRLETMADALAGAVPEATVGMARVLVGEWLARIENELGPPAAAGVLDPRFVEVLLVSPA